MSVPIMDDVNAAIGSIMVASNVGTGQLFASKTSN